MGDRDKGIDPIAKRNAEKAANLAAKTPVNFIQAAETHLEAHAPSWRHKYARATWFNPVKKYAYPIIGELPFNDIVATHVAAIVRAAAADGNLETGKRVQQRIRKIINGAIARGERDPLRGQSRRRWADRGNYSVEARGRALSPHSGRRRAIGVPALERGSGERIRG